MFAEGIAFRGFIWCWAHPVCDSWVSCCTSVLWHGTTHGRNYIVTVSTVYVFVGKAIEHMSAESLMTSRELTSGFDLCSSNYFHMAVMHLSTKFDGNIFIQSGNIDIFRDSIWLPPPSWILIISEFVPPWSLSVFLSCVPNCVHIFPVVSETLVRDVWLMTSYELTSGPKKEARYWSKITFFNSVFSIATSGESSCDYFRAVCFTT